MIPTFNCVRYLAETLASVLAQDPGPHAMQIEVVDDCSTRDDPETVVNAVGEGRVGYFRQNANIGHIRNFHTCLQRARGRLVHLLHGDDGVRPGFYTTMERAFAEAPESGAAFCRTVYVDEVGREHGVTPALQAHSGILESAAERLAEEQRIMTPAMVVRREVYEALGSFDSRLVCAEDWEMWVRIAASYPVWFENESLAFYRMHLNSNTGRHVASGDDIRYTRRAIEYFGDYLPPHSARGLMLQARKTYALAALRTARSVLRNGDRGAALAQMRAALECSRSLRVWCGVLAVAVCAAAPRRRFPQPLKMEEGN